MKALRLYEGRRCYWRVAAGALALGATAALLVALAVLTVQLPNDGALSLGVFIAAVLIVVAPSIAKALRRWRPWRQLIARRLSSYEQISRDDRGAAVPLPEADVQRAVATLRQARLNPAATRQLGSPPPDAPRFTVEVTAYEPTRHRSNRGQSDFGTQVSGLLTDIGVEHRLAGVGKALAAGSPWGIRATAKPEPRS